jgi:transcriptional regulator with XRE-family HTH domain
MKIDNFFNELINENEELKNSIELIDLKYKVIQALYNFRKANKLSQKDFAEKIGVQQQAISRFEKGEIDPRLSFIEKVLQGINSEILVENKSYIKMNRTLEFKSKTKKVEPTKYRLALS